MNQRLISRRTFSGLLIVTAAGQALAQDKPVKILVGLPAGGAVDMIARLLAEKLQTALGQSVIVENRPGAQTRIAVQALKAAPPDGSTLLVSPGAILTLYPHMFKQLGYDPFKDMAPVAMLAISEYGLAVPTESPVKTVAQFVEWAKANPKSASYATPSTGSPQHFLGILLARQSGAALEAIGYRGAADAMTALMGNQVPAAILSQGELVPAHQAGKIRVLATFGNARAALLPDVPTIKEATGFDYSINTWYAAYAPAKTPRPIVDKLNAAFNKALKHPEMVKKADELAIELIDSTPEQAKKFYDDQMAFWDPIIKKSGAKPE